jgi:glyoxylase-like metal-dependent hydrolase (beta-lactamase superfamily II)
MQQENLAFTQWFPKYLESVRGFSMVSGNTWVHTGNNGFNTAVILGSQAVLVVDTRTTPSLSMEVMQSIRAVTMQPIRFMALTHYRSVREFVHEIDQEYTQVAGTCPANFRASSEIRVTAGETWVTLALKQTLELGKLKVQILQLHSDLGIGETVVWVPSDHTVVCGDLGHFDGIGANPSGDAVPDRYALAVDAIAKMLPRTIVLARGQVIPSHQGALDAA